MNKAERAKLALAERDKARADIYLEILGFVKKRKQWYERLIDCGPLGVMLLYMRQGRWEVDWFDKAEHWNGKALVKED